VAPPKPSLGVRIMRGTGTVFIVLGAVILYFVAYELVGTSLQTHAHQSALRKEFDDLLRERVTPSTLPSASASPKPGAKPKVNGIAELIIPKIGIDDIVVEGITLYDLAFGPGHYTDSAPIGGVGTTAIAGHRTGWGSPFIRLDELGAGDLVVLKTPQATYTYRVTRSVIVKPTDYWVVQGDPQSRARSKLTLTTCTPKYTSRNRLIVWGDLIKTEPRVT
jgi:sortase A